MLAALLIPFPVLGPSGRRTSLLHELENLCHPLAFAALALVLARTTTVLRGRARQADLAWIGVLLVTFGAVTELLQAWSGRDASVADFLGDVIGCGIGMGLHWMRQLDPVRIASQRMVGGALALATILVMLPLSWTLAAYASRHAHYPVFWRSDSPLLHRFSRHQEGSYPGLDILEPPADWREFRELLITARNPGATTATFAVRVHDSRHDNRYVDRFNQEFQIAAGATGSYAMPVENIGKSPVTRPMDLSRIANVMVFQLRDRNEPRVEILEVRLAR